MFRDKYNIKSSYSLRKKETRLVQNLKLVRYFSHIIFYKIFYFILVVFSMLFINFSIKNKEFDIFFKKNIIELSKPIYYIAELPFNVLSNFIYSFKNIIMINNYNGYLLQENKILKSRNFISDGVLRENESLKNVLNFINNLTTDYEFVTSKIYSKSKSNINHTMIVNVGNVNGIVENSLVLGESGSVIGRVTGISDKFSEILLLNDIKSRIPARVGEYNERVILSGNNEEYLDILYFYSKEQNFKDGDYVYTSGDSDLIPDGILIGKIVFKNNLPFVKMNEDVNRLFNVVVIKK